MIAIDLRSVLEDHNITQVQFARLLGVTPRTVNMWLQGDREIPGPVEAYVRLLCKLPIALREDERARASGKENSLKEGMYRIEFSTLGDPSGWGFGVLVFDGGRIFGIDAGGAKYDGEYKPSQSPATVNVRLKVTFPAHGMSIFGIAHPHEWAIEVHTQIDVNKESGPLTAVTNLGHKVEAHYAFVRALPE